MAHIAPFRALRYDPGRVAPGDVVTQPYDKISPEMQERYYQASPYNLVRIILGRPEAGDSTANSVYTRAATHFHSWRSEGILKQDPESSLYLYSQTFTLTGWAERLERKGFIAIGRLEDYSGGIVFRHEQTLSKPKADRLDLLRATRGHFGQLFMLYEDGGEIERLMATSAGNPDTEVTDEYGVIHRLSRLSDPALVQQVCASMADKKLIIADGHHRYETALNYRNERRLAGETTPGAAHDFAMMTFFNMTSPGLVVLPTHRVVHSLASFSVDALQTAVRPYFNVEIVDPSIDGTRATAILKQAGIPGTALLAVTASRIMLLHTSRAFGSPIMKGLPLLQQNLDVVQLHRCILETALGLSPQAILNQQNIRYVRSADEALASVREGGANAAFLMNPVSIKQVRDIASAGEVLPQKSTDFYPKLLSGLTIYALD
jgi:uncharacterized protein (DUF1015 family)